MSGTIGRHPHLRRILRATIPAKRVSIVIACHNEEGYLQRTVDSFLRQLPQPSEIIVVDDQSTDGCCDFLSDRRYSKVLLAASPQRLGVSGARNFGASHAQGELLLFCDAHVVVPAGWWPPLWKALADPAVGAVAPAIGVLDSSDHVQAHGMTFSNDSLDVEWLYLSGEGPHAVPLLCGCFMVMRRQVYQEVQGFDPGMLIYGNEDVELSMHLWMRGYECRVIPEVTVAHRFSSEFRYPVDWEPLYNLLRMGVVHLEHERFFRLIESLADHPQMGLAWNKLASSDVWARREQIRLARRYDDDWYFEKFARGESAH